MPTIARRLHWVHAFSASSGLGTATATDMDVRMTVGAGLHTSTRRKIRVRCSRCQSDFLQGTRNKDRVTRVYANPILSPPELRYPPVACPSHLTMLSKLEAFSFHLIIFRPLLAPQTRITISKLAWARRPGAVAAAGTKFPAVSCGVESPFVHSLRCALRPLTCVTR